MAKDPTRFNRGNDALANAKGREIPLGHVEEVRIPPLDADPIVDAQGRPMTMHDQAAFLQDPTNPASPYYNPAMAAQAEQMGVGNMDPIALREARESRRLAAQHPQPQRRAPQGPFGGLVSKEDMQDPAFRPGVGSQFMANQPELMRKKQMMAQGKTPMTSLSDDTVEGLQALGRFQQQAEEAQKEELSRSADAEVEAAQRAQQDKLFKEMGIDNPEAFFSQFRANVSEIDTPELKKAIEDRCDPMDIEQLITEGELRQEVPIVRGKLIVVFRTMSGEEDLELKRMLFKDGISEQLALDMMSVMQLTCGLYAVNGRPLTDHLNDSKGFDEAKFRAKFKQVKRFPVQMISSLSVNHSWFDRRTRRLFVDLDELKNG